MEHVFNVLETLRNRHVKNVPHMLLGLLSETSWIALFTEKGNGLSHDPRLGQGAVGTVGTDRLDEATETPETHRAANRPEKPPNGLEASFNGFDKNGAGKLSRVRQTQSLLKTNEFVFVD